MEKLILPKSWQDQPKSLQIWQDQLKSQQILARSTQVPANLARLTNVGLHSSFSTLMVHMHQVPLTTHQVPLAKNKE